MEAMEINPLKPPLSLFKTPPFSTMQLPVPPRLLLPPSAQSTVPNISTIPGVFTVKILVVNVKVQPAFTVTFLEVVELLTKPAVTLAPFCKVTGTVIAAGHSLLGAPEDAL